MLLVSENLGNYLFLRQEIYFKIKKNSYIYYMLKMYISAFIYLLNCYTFDGYKYTLV